MSYYPQLGGITTALPYETASSFETVENNLPSGQHRARARRTGPLGKWIVRHGKLSAADLDTLHTFFVARHGRLETFAFLDPAGNLVPQSEDFSHADWVKTGTSQTASGVTDPFGGTLAKTVTSSTGNGTIRTVILPDGGASGFVLNLSIWARVASGTQTLRFVFVRSDTDGPLSAENRTITTTWARYDFKATIAEGVNVGIRFGGESTWGSGVAIDLFGAQVNAMPGPGAYAKTPGDLGLHDNCRFDTDVWDVEYQASGLHSLRLPIVEFVA